MTPASQSTLCLCWNLVLVFAAAMAWVESAVVFYLRTMVNRIEPYQPDPLPIVDALGWVELVRELATLVMLFAVGALAGRTWRERVGYSAFAFGAWDVLYYGFLKVMCNWPHSLRDWDILFLLPLPWWGPVWAPMAIAGLMMIWGTLVTRPFAPPAMPGWVAVSWLSGATGMVLALLVFMADALRVAGRGVAEIRRVLPTSFPAGVFVVALILMSAPVVLEVIRWWKSGCLRHQRDGSHRSEGGEKGSGMGQG